MSALRDFLELMRGGDGSEDIGMPCAVAGAKGRFAEPWRSWERACERIRQHLAREERLVCGELDRFLAVVRQQQGAWRAEAELDLESDGRQLLGYVERLLEEMRERQECCETGA